MFGMVVVGGGDQHRLDVFPFGQLAHRLARLAAEIAGELLPRTPGAAVAGNEFEATAGYAAGYQLSAEIQADQSHVKRLHLFSLPQLN